MDIYIGKNRLICFATGENASHGNGSMVTGKMAEYVNRYWKVSDRICVMEVMTKSSRRRGKGTIRYRAENVGEGNELRTKLTRDIPADHAIIVVNVYAPTSGVARKDHQQVKKLYGELKELLAELKKLSTKTLIITGDFNAKVGKNTGTENCIGRYSRGVRNQNGQELVNFCEMNNLFICNTAFKHPARHITTWVNQRKTATNETTFIYNQIDYIIVQQEQKHVLEDARSYGGSETISDHKIVRMRMQIQWCRLYKKAAKQEQAKQFDTPRLVNDQQIQKTYKSKLNERIQKLAQDGNLKWENIKEEITKTAEETIGFKKITRQKKISDPELERLSTEQQKIRLTILNSKDTTEIEQLKRKRNKILKEMTKQVADRQEKEVDEIVANIDNAKDDARMYQAVKYLHRKPPENSFVHDNKGRCVTNKQSMYNIINEHFKSVFHKEDVVKVEPFKENVMKKLRNPITTNEIAKTASKMANNRATADIPAELVKYAPASTHKGIATALNNMFEEHQDINIGEGTLLPIQKPKPKTVGPVKNLRPITLTKIIRKLLSKTTTTRIAPKTKTYLSQSQSAYREGRSTSDIVWSYRWVAAKVQEVDIKIYIIGIDMSSAFDTIDRAKLMEIVETFLDDDEVRFIRRLLSNTTLEIRVKGAKTTPFESNIGSPQGGSISGPLFEIYFEHSLREVRFRINKFITEEKITKKETSLPEEMIYADDCDFITEEDKVKRFVNTEVSDILLQDNLLVNTDKTENTTLQRHTGKDAVKKEEWRRVKKLGSLLGDREDISRRKSLSTSSLRKLDAMWVRKKLKTTRRMKLYNSLVRSILLYNCSTWGMSVSDERKMDSFHRQQLRHMLNIKYPNKISSKQLYKTTHSHTISADIVKQRWKLFRHTLRMDKERPARKAMKFYFEKTNVKKYRGRKRATIVTTLNRDIHNTKQQYPQFDLPTLNTEMDLHNMRVKAKNRNLWRKRVGMIFNAVYSSKMENFI